MGGCTVNRLLMNDHFLNFFDDFLFNKSLDWVRHIAYNDLVYHYRNLLLHNPVCWHLFDFDTVHDMLNLHFYWYRHFVVDHLGGKE